MANRRNVIVVEIDDRLYLDVHNMLQYLDRNGFQYERKAEKYPQDQNGGRIARVDPIEQRAAREQESDNDDDANDEQQQSVQLAEERRQRMRDLVDLHIGGDRMMQCSKCPKRIASKRRSGRIDLTPPIYHAYTHLRKPMFRCAQARCHETFDTLAGAQKHMRDRHQGGTVEDLTAEFHDDILATLSESYDA